MKAQFTVRLEQDLVAHLDQLANEQRRGRSYFIEAALTAYLAAHGGSKKIKPAKAKKSPGLKAS